MTHIAVVKLAPGQCGFYDDLSGTHLSLINREAKIMQGVNTAGLVNAVKAGKITVVSGSIGSETFAYKEAVEAIPTYYRLLEKKAKEQLKNKSVKTVKARELVKEENKEIEIEVTSKVEEVAEIIEEVITEPVVEEVVTEEPVVEEIQEAPKKRSRKKKATTEETKED